MPFSHAEAADRQVERLLANKCPRGRPPKEGTKAWYDKQARESRYGEATSQRTAPAETRHGPVESRSSFSPRDIATTRPHGAGQTEPLPSQQSASSIVRPRSGIFPAHASRIDTFPITRPRAGQLLPRPQRTRPTVNSPKEPPSPPATSSSTEGTPSPPSFPSLSSTAPYFSGFETPQTNDDDDLASIDHPLYLDKHPELVTGDMIVSGCSDVLSQQILQDHDNDAATVNRASSCETELPLASPLWVRELESNKARRVHSSVQDDG